MKNIILIILVSFLLFPTSCVWLEKQDVNYEEVLPSIDSKTYVEDIKPLVDVIYLIYKDKLSEQERQVLLVVGQDLDRQAADNERVYLISALFVSAKFILYKQVEPIEMSAEEKLASLLALELVNKKLGNSPMVEAIYPILKDLISRAEIK